MRIWNCLIIPLYLVTIKVSANNFKEHFFNVDKLEVYYTQNNKDELTDVKYFEGKIIIRQIDSDVRCISARTGDEYLKFSKINDNSYKVSADFNEACAGIIDINLLNKNVFTITLKDKELVLKYYLTQLYTDDEIYSKRASGSGILLSNGKILTNFHVVENFQKIVIEYQDRVTTGNVKRFDAMLDIALIETDSNLFKSNQFLNFANYNVSIGQSVYVCGFPLLNTMGKELKITSGIISSLKGFNDDKNYLQTTAPVDPGNSGGPLIDEYGNIIGLISAKHKEGTNVGYALTVNSLVEAKFITNVSSIKTKLSVQQIYNKSKNTLCIIKSYSF